MVHTDAQIAEIAAHELDKLRAAQPHMPARGVVAACRAAGRSISHERVRRVRDAYLDLRGLVEQPKAAPKDGIEIRGEDDRLAVNAKGQGLVRSLEDLIEEGGINVDEWRCERHRVNTWTTAQRGPDDEPVIVRHWQVRGDFTPRVNVEDLAAKVAREYKLPEVGEPRSILVVPDSQHGYRWAGVGRDSLEAMHDEAACAVVPVVAAKMQPDVVVLLGDHLDLAEWSTRFARPTDLLATSQFALQTVHDWIASIRASAPNARIVYIEGNHEDRIRRGLVEQASPAQALRAVNDTEDALSVARLLALSSLGVEYVGPYGSDVWIEGVRFVHGEKVRPKGGATAAAVLADATTSTWFGHVHRLELAQRTIHDHNGPRVITAASPGCLCRVDGGVPGVTQRPDWQQGLGFVWLGEAGQEWSEVRPIRNGRLRWDGVFLSG